MKKRYSEKNMIRFGWTKEYAVVLKHLEFDYAGILDTFYVKTLGAFDNSDDALKFLEEQKRNHSRPNEDGVEEHISIETNLYNKKGEWKGFEYGII